MVQHEAILATRVSKFMQLQYPKVIFRFDIADLNLTMPQANRMKALQGERRGYPDMFIAEPKNGFHGLYIELKKDYSSVFKKDGSYKKDDHVQEQSEYHKMLREKGYAVEWGLGLDDTVAKIREYMSPTGKERINEKQGVLL